MSTENQKSLKEWFYESDTDEVLGIETIIYENGGKCKRCTLSDGRVAQARRLKAKDAIAIKRITGNEEDKYKNAVICESTTIDDKKIIIEDIDEMWHDDYIRMSSMSLINFPSPQK